MNKYQELIITLVLFAVGALLSYIWWREILAFLKGAVPLILLLFGLLFLLITIEDFKEE
ncbi:MAG: hypothetical protein QW210_00275 [Candidatus Woesearchaeota archaeon]